LRLKALLKLKPFVSFDAMSECTEGNELDGEPLLENVIVERDSQSKFSPMQAAAMLVNAAVGAGVLSLPYAFQSAGWAGALLVLVVVGSLQSFTLYVLSRWAEQTGSSSYGTLVYRALGPNVSIVVNIVVFVYLYGSAVAYLVILGDCLTPFARLCFGPVGTWYTNRKVLTTVFSTAFILPMCFGNLNSTTGASIVNFFAFLVVIGIIMLRSVQTIIDPKHSMDGIRSFSPNIMTAVPITVFGLQCHAQVASVYDSLSDELLHNVTWLRAPSSFSSLAMERTNGAPLLSEWQRLSSNCLIKGPKHRKSPKVLAMTLVIAVAIGTTAVGYAVVGLSAYMAFPTSVQSNVLNTFPENDPLIQVARGVVGLLQIASFPINHLPARNAARDIVSCITGSVPGGRSFVIVETVLFFFTTLAISLLVTDLGAIFSVVGGTCGSVIIFGVPGVLLLKYSYGKRLKPIKAEEEATLRATDSTSLHACDSNEEFAVKHLLKSKLYWTGWLLLIICIVISFHTIMAHL
jgi:sodium-coupled neutral amino acid transporter 7/8